MIFNHYHLISRIKLFIPLIIFLSLNKKSAAQQCNNWLYVPANPGAVTVGDLDVSGNQITVEAQFNRTSPLNSGVFYGHLVSKHTGANANYTLLPNGCEITTTVSGYKATFQNCVPQLNKTYHVAMVYDGASLKFYRNGFLLSQTPCTGNMVTNDLVTTIAQISSSGNPSDNQFLGYVNEVRIWNVARTQNELRSFMNAPLPNPTAQTGLLGYYSFDNLINKQGNAAFNGTASGSGIVNQSNPNCSFIVDSCNVIQTVVTSDFTMPDTVCVNTQVNITNTSTGASSHFWNFCVGNINQNPTGVNLGNFGGLITTPVFMDYVFENNNYYGFVVNFAPGKLIRLDFGNSLLNTPTPVDIGNVGGVIPIISEGIQVVKNEGKWYAIIVAGYLPGGSTPRVLKIDFGANITNTSPTGTNWGNIGNLLNPIDLHVFQESGNWYGFTVNAENNTITRFNFTNSFDNTPTAINLGNIGNLSYPTGIYAINDNNNWRVFIVNAGNNSRTGGPYSLTRLDFGSSLLNTPAGVNLGNPGNFLNHPRDLTIMKFCGQIIGFAVNGAIGSNDIVKMDFNSDLASTPVFSSLGNIGNLSFPHSISKIFRDGADLYSFVTNVDNRTVTRLRFTGCTNSSIANFAGQNPPPFMYTIPGTYNVNLTIDDGLPTQSGICKQIVVVGNPFITISNDTSICRNNAVQLLASGGSSYLWSPAATLSSPSLPNPIASPTANTTYYVTVTNTSGCSNTDSVKVNVAAVSQFTASPVQSVCINETVQLNASGGDIYMWAPATSLDNALIPNPVASPLIATNYTVTITDTTCNESSTLTVPVTVHALPVISAAKSNDIDCSNSSAQLSATGASQYIWSPAATLNNAASATPTSNPITTTQYYVTGTDQFGCTNFDSVTVAVGFTQKGGYLMASAFTPNNDGLNDCFGIKYWGPVLELEFNIYNRWGERVFHTTNPADCWNGKFKGVEQKTDVYVYWVRAKTVCEPLLFRKGTITLIR